MKKNSHSRKQAGLAVAAAFLLSALMPTLSFAAADVVAGDLIKFSDGVGSGPGGEFNIDRLTNGSGIDFITFCLEKNEFLSFGTTYKVASVTSGAMNGGFGGGNPDPISFATAWLYSQFRSGGLATYGYVYGNAASADALQNAIWSLEDEIGAVGGLAATFKTAGLTNGTSLYNVQVMNVQTLSGGLAQDQLTLVPEPETYAMLLAGLGLMGFVARRRQRKLAAA